MKEKINNLKYILIICVIAILVSIPLFWKNLNVYNCEGIEVISRAYETYISHKNGDNTSVLSNLSNGFGYGISLFSVNLSSFVILLCKFITNNFIIAYKLSLFLGLILSGITMYFYVKKITKSNNMGVLSGVIYMIIPYHLNTMYISNNFSEFLSFLFIPLIFLGLYNLFYNHKKEWIFVIRISRINYYKFNNSNIYFYISIWIYL